MLNNLLLRLTTKHDSGVLQAPGTSSVAGSSQEPEWQSFDLKQAEALEQYWARLQFYATNRFIPMPCYAPTQDR